MRTVWNLVCWLLHAYSLILLVRVVISWVRPRENRWTTLLYRVTEPVLAPVRTVLARIFPNVGRMIDFSPMVVILLIQLLQRLVAMAAWR